MTVTVDSKTQWFGGGGTQVEAIDTWVIHTTEGGHWPGYAGGSQAPNETIMPLPGRGIVVRRHYPDTASAMALVNLLGGVQTNRGGVNQTELVGTCVKGGPGYYWPAADDVVLAALAAYKRPFLVKHKVPFAGPAMVSYPDSFGRTPGRMTNAEWLAFRGICGHQHVPENLHGDPGAFPITKLIAALNGTTTPEDDMPFTPEQLADYAGEGVMGARVGRTEARPGMPLTVGVALDRIYAASGTNAAMITALTAAIAALAAAQPGVDGATVLIAIQTEVKAALAGLEITLKAGV